MKLPINDFKNIVKFTPLVSIDLIIRNSLGNILLGKRNNCPAKNYWFVPGGRILKDEFFQCAFKRIVKDELRLKVISANFKGLYQHFYEDNFSEDDFSTHYIVLAYEIVLTEKLDSLPLEQHSQYKWFNKEELITSENVHKHTKWYFQEDKKADACLNVI